MKHKFVSAVLAMAVMFSASVSAYAACPDTASAPTCPETRLLLPGCNGSDGGSGWEELLWQLLAGWLGQCPTTPSEPATPCEPGESCEPATPCEPGKPCEPAAPAEPDQPAEPIKPAEPAAPTEAESKARAYEREVIRLVNEERAKAGLAALQEDAQLTRTARMKSQDMHDRGYFDHNSPTYGTPFQLMKSQGITYRTAGENIAMGYRTPEAVVAAWMNSPGHRANILNASYTKIGVGYVAAGNYCTQHFIG